MIKDHAMKFLRHFLLPAVICPLCVFSTAQAKLVSNNVALNISGTIVATASCTFSTATPVLIEFGDVYENEIAGEKYKQLMPWQVTCKGDPDGKTVQMRVAGTGASYNGNNLKTSVDGLGIKLLKGSAPLMLNQWFDLDTNNPPTLYAVLEKQNGVRFQDGESFTTSATLQVAYN